MFRVSFFFQAEDGIRDDLVTVVQTCVFFFQAEDGIRDDLVTGVQTCALPICPGVGAAVASHPDIDMVSFTGSTRAGILVAKMAAETVKRVAQGLGGKSANILLDDVNLDEAVTRGVTACFTNSGQSCSIPTRMLVPRHLMNDAAQIAKRAAEAYRVGPTDDPATQLGPLVNRNQFERVQTLIQMGIDEGARLM